MLKVFSIAYSRLFCLGLLFLFLNCFPWSLTCDTALEVATIKNYCYITLHVSLFKAKYGLSSSSLPLLLHCQCFSVFLAQQLIAIAELMVGL